MKKHAIPILILVVISVSSCNIKSHSDYLYNYCDNKGIYGELFFYEDTLVAFYSTYDCNKNSVPIGQIFISEVYHQDSLLFRNIETRKMLFSAKYGIDYDGVFFIEIYNGQSYDTMRALVKNSYYQPFTLSNDSLEIWHKATYYNQFLDRLNHKNCNCEGVRNEREVELNP